jgi:hypothetical protein
LVFASRLSASSIACCSFSNCSCFFNYQKNKKPVNATSTARAHDIVLPPVASQVPQLLLPVARRQRENMNNLRQTIEITLTICRNARALRSRSYVLDMDIIEEKHTQKRTSAAAVAVSTTPEKGEQNS